jgi:hypothetical protein
VKLLHSGLSRDPARSPVVFRKLGGEVTISS